MEYFNPISAVIEGTGALFNSSKKRFVWRFELDLEEHSVELECSFLTNKRRVTYDGNLIFRGLKQLWSNDFQYQFKQKAHVITVFNHRNDANLLIDSLSFDIVYSKKILGNVKGFGNKDRGRDVREKVLEVEGGIEAKGDKGPKPARFLSDEEYEKAVSLSRSDRGPKKSLRDILEKNQSEKPGTGKNRDLFSAGDEKNKDLIEWDGPKGNRSEKCVVGEDFLNLGSEDTFKNKGVSGNNKITEDLFQLGFEKSPSLNENFRSNHFGGDFLELEPSKPKNSDFLDLGPGAQMGLNFLELEPSGVKNSDIFDMAPGPQVNLNKKRVGEDFLSLGETAHQATLIFDEPQKNLDFLCLDSEKSSFKAPQIPKPEAFLMENFDFKAETSIPTFSNLSIHPSHDLLFEEPTPTKVQVPETKPSQYPSLDIFSPVPVPTPTINSNSPSPFTAPSR